MAEESEVNRENREEEKEITKNKGVDKMARGSKAANRRSSSQKELFSFPAFRQSKTRTDPSSLSFVFIYFLRFARENYESSYFTSHCVRFDNARCRLFLL